MVDHVFGGHWTEKKLDCLSHYLEAYTKIFAANEQARHFRRIYVDGFAGTGSRSQPETLQVVPELFDEYEDARRFLDGSARRALKIHPPFHEYVFVENNPQHVMELCRLREQYPDLSARIKVLEGDANDHLVRWASLMDTHRERAVVFLDPYGMSVEWNTLEELARTKAVDLWILVPHGQAVNRLLTRRSMPNTAFERRLTSFFGTDEWKEEFYESSEQGDLFDDEFQMRKNGSHDSIGRFFIRRLETVFAKVAHEPLVLRNSRNSPIFLLCFAAANPKGAPTAVKIAQHLLRDR